MDWNVVSLEDVEPKPWRNGGGLTRELLAWPHADEWRIRISVADVERDGPFSYFPAADRWFSVLEGKGVKLTVGGGTQVLTPDSEPFGFSGNADVHCSLLAGPTRDFNLMALPGAGRVLKVRDVHVGVIPARTLVAGYAPRGGTIAVYDEYVLDLAPETLVWRLLEQEGPMVLEGTDALWVEVRL
jgi:environmental stress-induced protein Ves